MQTQHLCVCVKINRIIYYKYLWGLWGPKKVTLISSEHVRRTEEIPAQLVPDQSGFYEHRLLVSHRGQRELRPETV